ncbi:TonB-dependent receptor [Brevundimonas sanguinis]|uniref:TonB-dependent receptor n=1 Tax=Brevundimonas sanguinis TaxID=3021811 RepID=UPI00241595E6|nr:TonB-dependent receptor [Brevundimonas sp. NCCP 15609]
MAKAAHATKLSLLSTAALICAAFPLAEATAQQQPTETAVSVDEVVVTARRRDEALQDVPLAVTVMSSVELERRRIDTIAQMGESVPNMTFQTGAPTGTGASTPSIFIRGIGSSETSLGTEPGVGLYVDDVYIARSVGSVLDLVSPESVQVLRGPQGTLFGRNSVGGAMLIRSSRPGHELGGFVEATAGNFDRRDARFSFDAPLTDTLRLNLAGLTSNRDGYVESADSAAMGSIDRYAGRLAVEWDAAPNVRVSFAADAMRADETAMPAVLLGLVDFIPGTQFAPGGPFPSEIFAISNNSLACGGASTTGNSGNPACIDQQHIQGPFKTAGGYQAETDIFDSQGSRPYGNTAITEVGGASFRVEWDLSDRLTFKSITAYRELEAYWASNSDHTPNPGIETKNDQTQNQFTQEFQLLGEGDQINWVLGAFYMKEEGESLNVVAFPSVIFRSGGSFATESTAVFAQGTYEITPSLELTLGARYTQETKSYDTLRHQEVVGVLLDPATRFWLDLRATPVPFITGATPDIATDEFTPLVSLAYHWSPDVMTYLSFSRGYKSGGYEQRLAPGTPEVPRFNPEYVDAYEFGVKATLLDRSMQVGAAVFHSTYSDMQISVVDGVSPTITNAGDATLQGAEVELNWRPAQGLNINAFAGYLDASYDSLSPRALVSGITLASRLPNTSEWQYGGSISYEMPLGSSFTITPHVDWSYRSSMDLDSANEALLHQPGYSLVNAAVTLAPVGQRWALSVSGRNLTDETYLVSGIAQYNIGEIEGQYARPREWAATLKYRF